MKNYINFKFIDDKELESIDVLNEKYKKIVEPGLISKTTKKISNLIPTDVTNLKNELSNNIYENKLFVKMINLVDEGFSKVEETASKYSMSEKGIIKKFNKDEKINISKLEDICWLKSYDIAKIVNSYKTQDIAFASIEGASTGILGLPGLPFNLVLSTFLYFRAVQSIAMFYGYDVKNNPDELLIASEVLKNALNPDEANEKNIDNSVINKILIISKAEAVKQMSKKTWTEMASNGGVTLLLTKLRALGHNSAKRALETAGESGLEHSVFKDILKEIGKRLPKKAIPKIAMGISALFSSLIDGKQMKNILDYADIFYQKRFILEKEYRIKRTNKYKRILIIKISVIVLILLVILLICINIFNK